MEALIRIGELVAAIVAAITLASAVQNIYRRTLGRRRRSHKALARLGTNAQLAFFTEILGEPPAIRRSLPEQAPAQAKQRILGKHWENIFVSRDFFVQAITNTDDTVVQYSVTTRTKRFRARLVSPGHHYLGPINPILRRLRIRRESRPIFDIRLWKNSFSELNDPKRVRAWLGARRYGYTEEHWLGNPGHYQTYVFSMNDVGATTGDIVLLLNELIQSEPVRSPERTWDFDFGDERIKDMPALLAFRRSVKINSYSVVGPNIEVGGFPLGPDADVLRTLL